MSKIFLEIYGISVEISVDNIFAAENLSKDFILYVSGENKGRACRKTISVHIFETRPPYEKVPPLEASLYSLGSICYRDKGVHYVDYSGRGLMIYDFRGEKAELYSEDESLLYEKAKLAILSRTGELLDQRHIHRIHAAGFSVNGQAAICLLPMEAGKTTLALGVIERRKDIKLIADDVCLVDMKNNVFPMLLRIGVRDKGYAGKIPQEYITRIHRMFYGEKLLIDLEYFKGRIVDRARLRSILIGKRVFTGKTEIRKISKVKCIMPFMQSGVFGLGLPQVVELFLRGDFSDIMKKTAMVFSRLFIFLAMVCRADTYELRIGRDKDKSAEELADFLSSRARL
ncbi:MAG: hypothetical protein WC312_06620 [Candidatus Omnitrophota bacterium]|jgi:hypothetical protein